MDTGTIVHIASESAAELISSYCQLHAVLYVLGKYIVGTWYGLYLVDRLTESLRVEHLY